MLSVDSYGMNARIYFFSTKILFKRRALQRFGDLKASFESKKLNINGANKPAKAIVF